MLDWSGEGGPCTGTWHMQAPSAGSPMCRGLGWECTPVQLLSPYQHLSLQSAGRRRLPIPPANDCLFSWPLHWSRTLARQACSGTSGFGWPLCNKARMMQGGRELSSKTKRQSHVLPCLGDQKTLLQKTRQQESAGLARQCQTQRNQSPQRAGHCPCAGRHCWKGAPHVQGCC